MRGDLTLYRDTATSTVYVVASRDRRGVTLRDLASEPGDPRGVIVVSEWWLWQEVRAGLWERCN